MKTLTEFSGFVLKDILAKKAALLAEGKTEEEVQTFINEQLKLDETKAPYFKNAIDMTSSRLDRVKRVVVALKATETEKVPEAFTEREGHFYLIEFFPTTSGAPARHSRDDRDFKGRGGKGGGRGRDGGGRDNSRGNDSRPAREPREFREPSAPRPPRDPNAAVFVSTGLGTLTPGQKKAPHENSRRPSQPREARVPRGPKGAGELRLVLKGQSTTLQGSAPASTEVQS